jgi:hypothetical protein
MKKREKRARRGEKRRAQALPDMAPRTDPLLMWDLPAPFESAEQRAARIAREAPDRAVHVADTLRAALWAAERIVRADPKSVTDAARRVAAVALAEVAHAATFHCERIALDEPALFGDTPANAYEWPVLCGRHKADNERLIGQVFAALPAKKSGRKIPSLRRSESNINWILFNVALYGCLPYRGRFVPWPEHPANAWLTAATVPACPMTRATFKDWFPMFMRFLRSVAGSPRHHPAFRQTATLPLKLRENPRPSGRRCDLRALVFKSLARIGLIVGDKPDSHE